MRKTVVLVASLAVAVLLAGGAASAALSNLADAGTVNVDGQVRTILEVGNRVYWAATSPAWTASRATA